MTTQDLQLALGNCKPRNVYSRMRALGLLVTCTRCAGSGHHSFNLTHGTMCYGCNGHTVTVPKRITKKLLTVVAAKVAAGGLDDYFAANRAAAAFRREIKPLITEITKTWSKGDIHTDFKKCPWRRDHPGIPITQGRVGGINKLWSAAKNLERSSGSYESAVGALKIILSLIVELNDEQANDKTAKLEVELATA